METTRAIDRLILSEIESSSTINVGSLTTKVSEKLDLREEDSVVSRIIELKEEGKISLEEKKPIDEMRDYLFSPASIWYWILLSLTIASILSIFLLNGGSQLYIRYALGSLLLGFLPGYSVLRFMYSRRAKAEMDFLAIVAVSIGLSLVIVASLGFVLNYSSLGIRLSPLVDILGAITFIFLTLAMRQEYELRKLSGVALRSS